MQHDDAVYLGHMLDMSQKAVSRTTGISRDVYDSSEDLRLSLTYLVQTIGEAASKVSVGTRSKNPEIPWLQIVGMRNRVVHDYLHVDFDIVWDVVTVELPKLITSLESALSGGNPPA